MEGAKKFWKRFAGWGTALKTKYDSDVFFKTRLKIIFFHILSVLLVIAVLGALLRYVHTQVFSSVLVNIQETLVSGTAPDDPFGSLVDSLRQTYIVIFSGLVLSVGIFAYFLAEVTLRPAKQAMEIRRRFIADVSHELRTPLSIMKTNTEVAMLGQLDPKAVDEIMHSNIEEINRISDIINNLLSFSDLGRSEAISFNDLDVTNVVHKVAKKLKQLAEKRKVAVKIVHEGPCMVRGNETALEQAVLNLLKNAIFYTGAKGSVHVNIAPDLSGGIRLSVRDTGLGISHKDLSRIFEPFFRTDASRARRRGGSGLGLPIVYEIIKLHHGKITINSLLGKGTTVTIILPESEASAKEAVKDLNQVSYNFSSST